MAAKALANDGAYSQAHGCELRLLEVVRKIVPVQGYVPLHASSLDALQYPDALS